VLLAENARDVWVPVAGALAGWATDVLRGAPVEAWDGDAAVRQAAIGALNSIAIRR